MADVIVTLNVDKSQISVQNVDPFCNFGQGPGITNEDFLTRVNAGDTVIWQGVSSVTPLDTVNITNINHSGGNSVFSHDNLSGNGQHPEKVSGAVRNNARGETEKYTIMFNVFNNGIRRPGIFSIDPKLAINP
ncbi:hypothetical protein ACFX5F_07480 [Flavobacterium sp. ZS1P70]|uniref:Uncharacterized protein n=1 Tax=Flavobacterium zhoui TaxID=3230414 RepID=A0ABW6I444_9FLAO